ncbi:hypothetical protein [Streptomyces sp. 058-1L]|uniref:hypothetical protein n=1 Tax=Streptomyces sp. 058-1L TaxID=2789266 RepID=UPI00397F46D2
MTQVDETVAGALGALEVTTTTAQTVQEALYAAYEASREDDSAGDWATFAKLLPDQAAQRGLSPQAVVQFLEYAQVYGGPALLEALLTMSPEQIAEHCVATAWHTLILQQAPAWSRYDCSDALWPDFRRYFTDQAAWLDPELSPLAEAHMAPLDMATPADRYAHLTDLGLPINEPETGADAGTAEPERFADFTEAELAALIDHYLGSDPA